MLLLRNEVLRVNQYLVARLLWPAVDFCHLQCKGTWQPRLGSCRALARSREPGAVWDTPGSLLLPNPSGHGRVCAQRVRSPGDGTRRHLERCFQKKLTDLNGPDHSKEGWKAAPMEERVKGRGKSWQSGMGHRGRQGVPRGVQGSG